MELKIELEDGLSIEFTDLEELEKWVEQERKRWEWLAGAAGSGQNNWKHINNYLSQITNGINNFRANPKQPQNQTDLNAVLSNIQSRINNGTYILSNSDLGGFIRAEGDNDAAFGAELLSVATLKNNVGLGNGKRTALAVCALSDFNRGVSKRGAQSTRKALAKLFADYETKISELNVSSDKLIHTLDDTIEKREKKVAQSTSNLARILGNHKSNLRNEQQDLRKQTKDETDGLLKTVKDELADFKDFYESQIALQEPVAYWKSKRVGHRIGSVVFAGLFLFYIFYCSNKLLKYVTGFDGGFTGFLDFWKEASLSSFGAFASLIALGLVFARLLYRLFASQLHLWNDASERVTMIQTYLALAQKGHAKEEFLGALLARLFSPSSDGVVKDDFGSVGPLDFVMKSFNK